MSESNLKIQYHTFNEVKTQRLTFEDALKKAGGIGKFQIISMILFVIAVISGDIIINNLAFFEVIRFG